MSGLRVPVVGPSCHVRHAPHPHNAASFSQRTCIRQFRQNADPFSQNSPISPFFTQLVCTLAAAPLQVAAVPSPIGGNCTTRGCDTPATRRKRASCSAKPPPSPVWRVLEGPGAWLRCPWAAAGSGPDKFRMQFPHDMNQRALKNRRISTIRLQYLKYTQGNCMRNYRDAVRTQHHTATRPRSLGSSGGSEGLAAVPVGGGGAWPRQISHAIPPRHDPTQAQKPQNINDQISKPEILSGELHAKLMGVVWSGFVGRVF